MQFVIPFKIVLVYLNRQTVSLIDDCGFQVCKRRRVKGKNNTTTKEYILGGTIEFASVKLKFPISNKRFTMWFLEICTTFHGM